MARLGILDHFYWVLQVQQVQQVRRVLQVRQVAAVWGGLRSGALWAYRSADP